MKVSVRVSQFLGAVFLLFLLTLPVSCEVKEQLVDQSDREVAGLGPYEKIYNLSGTVILKPWSKSAESWNAGGGSYYVLDVGDAKIMEFSAKEGVIIRFGEGANAEEFEDLIGKRVELTGHYVPKEAVTEPRGQYPVGIDGKPAPRGSGFKVQSFKLIQ
ncbi:MAG: hypothetical protein EVB09_02565 [Verrucomicrobiaceae bacterium]|nr:MAG: hypothetical protein EVB09_02565 [Verrucomicrobiaceae bacterium]